MIAQVFIILDYIASSKPSVESHFSMVLRVQAQFRLYYCSYERPVTHINQFANSSYAILWSFKTCYDLFRYAYIAKPQVFQIFQAKDISSNATQNVRYVTSLKQFHWVRNTHRVLTNVKDDSLQLFHVSFHCSKLCPCSYRALRSHPTRHFCGLFIIRFHIEIAYKIVFAWPIR